MVAMAKTTTLTRAIVAVWPGPNELVDMIALYALFTPHETTMINMFNELTRYKGNAVNFGDVSIRWAQCEDSKHWFEKRYTLAWKGKTSRLVYFDQLSDGSWIDAFRDRDEVMAAYKPFQNRLDRELSNYTPDKIAAKKEWEKLLRKLASGDSDV
jgi:hypothetical protein